MKELIYRIAKIAGMFALCRRLTRNQVRILAYHGIWIGEGHYGNRLYMSPQKFAHRMDQLAALGMPVLALDEAMEKAGQGELPDCATVITIDDGWYGTYLHMVPTLEKHQFPSMLYITSYYAQKQTPVFYVVIPYIFAQTRVTTLDLSQLNIGSDRVCDLSSAQDVDAAIDLVEGFAAQHCNEDQRQDLAHRLGRALDISYANIVKNKLFHIMSAAQIQDAANRGVDIQLHTHRHRITHEGQNCIESEIQENREFLEPLAGKPLKHFCYPSGLYNARAWPRMEKLGVLTSTTTASGFADANSHPYALPRILDGEQVSDLEFEAEMAGFGVILRRVRSVFRAGKDQPQKLGKEK